MFLTTTLPYLGLPHIGHAFEFVLGDAITRAHKFLLNKEVHFNVGLDEHGLKVWQSAQAQNISVQELIEQTTTLWLSFCEDFDISYNSFYKTSSVEHHSNVQEVWLKLLAQGDIYKKTYTGVYCVGCEAFKLNKDLNIFGDCSDHPKTKLTTVNEENYFFKLSNYKDILTQWISENKEFLTPNSSYNELLNMLAQSEDISISRVKESCPWGVAVPNDTSQVMYVWFDALLNYIFAAGYPNPSFATKWTEVVQLCGPDNLRFQAIIFQSFLEALKLPHTNKLLVHGTIVDENGQKMSKTLGNGVNPITQLKKYNLSAIRYYMLGGLNTYQTSSWIESDLVSLYNSQVANDWGNMVSRVLHLIDLKQITSEVLTSSYSHHFFMIVTLHKEEIMKHWENFEVKEAIQATNRLVKIGNTYINDNKVWASENYVEELSNLFFLLVTVNALYYPVFPEKYEETKIALKSLKKAILFTKL